MDLLRTAGVFGIWMAVICYVIMATATGAGYDAAMGDSQSYADARAEMVGAIDTTQRTLTENATGVVGHGAAAQAGPLLAVLDATAGRAFDFGYGNPTMAWWYLRVSPAVVALSLVAYALGTWRAFRGGGSV